MISKMSQVPEITLNNGLKMPAVGFGLWKVDKNTCADQVYEAIKAGYRLLDGACSEYIAYAGTELGNLTLFR